MDSVEINSLIKKTEDMVSGHFIIGGEKWDVVPLILENLHKFATELISQKEKKESHTRKIECNVGCPYCCYTKINLTPCEALHIGQYIRNSYSLRQIDALMKKITGIIRLTKGKQEKELLALWRSTPCIFLENDKCTIYSHRPFLCRAWHSLSADQCKRAFETDREDAEIDIVPYYGAIYGAVRKGLTNVMRSMGLEWDTTDIVSAVKVILTHPDPFAAWFNGENLFH